MTVTTENLLTADDLLRLYSQDVRGELLRGVLHETQPTGIRHGKTVVNLIVLLAGYVEPRQMGTILASDVGFLLEKEPDTVREPDVALISAQRLPLDQDVPGFFEGPPDLAVEIASPSDSPRQLFDKARMWISFGVPLVWTVDPAARTLDVHKPNQPLIRLSADDTLDGGQVLPGFTCTVADLF
ncbi:MAG: Uma2 family endonuclease [Caldilineaceae bacterium]|nr:Uma2 family endonuclease [bacterium]MDE0465212.1 Uma2 family endonuclease [Caldilineaceae bacterium]